MGNDANFLGNVPCFLTDCGLIFTEFRDFEVEFHHFFKEFRDFDMEFHLIF